MAKHTPGPWNVNHLADDTVRAADGTLVAEVYRNEYEPWNQKLIAAAPDALAACKMALAYLNYAGTENFERGGDRHVREVLEAAIRKAEE